MHDDDITHTMNTTEAAADLRKKFEEFAKFVAREMVELVVVNSNYLHAARTARLEPPVNGAVPSTKITDPLIYVVCHRLLTAGKTFDQRVMSLIADELDIGAIEH
jgi:hypothetical protein